MTGAWVTRLVVIGLAGILTACASGGGGAPSERQAAASAPPSTASAIESATPPDHTSGSVPAPGDLPVMEEGPISPGTYVVMPPGEGWFECVEGVDCAPPPDHARTMQLEITVPDGWESLEGFDNKAIVPSPGSSEGPDGAGLAIGWYAAGLHTDPCRPVPHSTPDILIGPSAEDFVDAVVAHPLLDVTDPVEVQLGDFSGQFLTLTAPSDISDCVDWRPWEHGIYAQGPNNFWNLWVMDVDGLRFIILAQEFPGTSADDSADLRAMVESIRFVPSP